MEVSLVETLVRRWLKPLTRFAAYLLDPDLKGDDLDVAEEALVICWRRLATGTWSSKETDSVESFGPSLYRTVKQLVLNRNRKARCTNETDIRDNLLDSTAGPRDHRPENLVEQAELCHAVQRAIAELPEEFRIVVVLCYIEELPVETVAWILDMPEGTIKSRCARAREKLKGKLAPWFDQEVSAVAWRSNRDVRRTE